MKEDIETKISSANTVLISGGLTLVVFWVLNILKTASSAVKNFLTFYKPIGPLLGLYIISIISFFIFRVILKNVKIKNPASPAGSQNQAFGFYVVSIVLFVFMVFPSIFEPIVHILNGFVFYKGHP